MDKNSLELLRKDALKALSENHLQEALTCIKGILFTTNDIKLSNEWESIQKDYEMMLYFMQQGGADPQRASIFRNLLNRSYTLLDMGTRNYRIQKEKNLYAKFRLPTLENEDFFGRVAKKARILSEKLSEDCNRPSFKDKETIIAEERKNFHETCDTLFNLFWTAPMLKNDEAKEWQTFMEEMDTDTQALLISAVMLANLQYFDPQKFRILLYFGRTPEIKVRARALTAIVWIYMLYEYRFEHYPDLCQGISLLASEPHIYRELVLLQKQFILSLDTVKVEKKLHNDILPSIIKNRIYQRNKMGLKDVEEELSKTLREEPNAEWAGICGDQKLADNMQEIIEMGKEGVDINIGTFSTLKWFPFFNEISHWFVPFNEYRPEASEVLTTDRNTPLRTLLNIGNFCDSDKYSLCMMFKQITPEQRELIVSQFDSPAEEHENMRKNIPQGDEEIKNIYRNYLQDLYRFYKLSQYKQLFNDPFQENLFYTHYNLLNSMMASPEYLMDMTSFLMKREYYHEAISYIENILAKNTATAEIFQKIAFCYQQLNTPEKAVYYYQQADLLQPNNEWIQKQMYLCYSALGKYENELSCLKKLLEINPDDSRFIAETGWCLMQLKRYEEAAMRFYELEYKETRLLSSWRAIAWCNFKMNKLEQAYKYYQKLLNHEKATWEDYLNAGHTAWCMNKLQEAVEHYRTYIRLYQKNKPQNELTPLRPFDEDKNELNEHGITILDIALMRDIIIAEPKES